MICEPPRHGKTEMVTVRYPVWRLEGNPGLRVIVGAYNQTMADRYSRKARRIAGQRLELSRERTAVDDWETTAGGGIRAVGVGSGVTGRGAHLIVIDDPVKSREEANSHAYRERLWEWYRDDLYTRLEPGGAMILIMTRWHEDDLAGRILASQQASDWTLVNLPAEAEENDPLGRPVGTALCPDRYDRAALEEIRSVLGPWSYAALYQQRPMPIEGALAQRQWFAVIERPPYRGPSVRAWDLAATQRKLASSDPDYVVGTLLRCWDGHYYICDVVRDRLGPGAVEELITTVAKQDGRNVWVYVPQDPGAAGKLAAGALVRALAGWVVKSGPVTGDKVTRAMPFLAQAEQGNVSVVRASWTSQWLEELCAFPMGAHDDQVDSVSDAFNVLVSRWMTPPPNTQIRFRTRRGQRAGVPTREGWRGH